jgi:hypothetical protein
MLYLIRRRPGVTREELVVHWFARHMPPVIESQLKAAAAGRFHAWRYIATLFDPTVDGQYPWDGIAALSFDAALPTAGISHGEPPMDSFQERALPYSPWATREYVLIDGSDRLPVTPSKLGVPFPCTRSGFFKITFLVKAKPGIDFRAMYDCWLDVHAPRITALMQQFGGLRYVLNLGIEPEVAPYAGMAELWFRSRESARQYLAAREPDDLQTYVNAADSLMLDSVTEMIGIPGG